MYVPSNANLDDPVFVHTFSENAVGLVYHGMRGTVPTSGTLTTNRIHYLPFYLTRPYALARWFWANGATAGTDYVEVGIYDKDFNLLRASPRTLSAGASANQYATPGIHGTNITSGGSTTDATSYATASVTLKTGVLYLLSVSNTKASAANAVSSIDGGPTFVSRSTTTFAPSTAGRISIWSCVPTTDYTGTLTINFGGGNTQTNCGWNLNAFYHVDTATNDGIVQNAVGTGTGTTALATLAAFGSANNATLGAFSNNATFSITPESAAYIELADQTTGVACGSHFRPDNDTTVSATLTSADWGACAVEIKSRGTAAVYVPPMRGYLALHVSGATATILRKTAWTQFAGAYLQSSTFGLPQLGTPATFTGSSVVPLFGFTRRATV